MRKFKKFLTLLVALSMVLTFNIAAFAAPSSDDKATVKVTNVEEGATVTAYQIVKGKYTSGGLTGWESVLTGIPATPDKPNNEEIQTLSKRTSELTTTYSMTWNATDKAYEASVPAGSYLVVVTGGTSGKIYNPLIVSASYADDGSLTGGTASANSNMNLNGQTAYAKSNDKPDVDKTIVGSGSGNNHGDDVAIGDSVAFEITGTIPSYSEQYTNATYTITDTLSAGLTAPEASAVTVKVGDAAVTSPNCTVSVNGQVITIAFSSEYILSIADETNRDVSVTYSAVLNENAQINMGDNPNTVKLTYSDTPTTTTDSDEKKTHTYTFGIDAALNDTTGHKTHEVTKVSETTTDEGTTTRPLAGAQFTLYDSQGNPVGKTTSGTTGVATSDNAGQLSFWGLDAGTYKLVETQAPTGYSLDSTPHKVEITATYNTDGTLASYSVVIDGTATSTYTATYDNGTITKVVYPGDDETTKIKNTKITGLPSTGGIGTYVFTIGGAAFMVIAIFMIVAGKRNRRTV